MEFPRDISYQLTTLLLNYLPENLDKKYITSLLEHDALWNFYFLIKHLWYLDFDWNEKNWIDNPIQSTKLDCNPDWEIQQYPADISITEYDLSNLHAFKIIF